MLGWAWRVGLVVRGGIDCGGWLGWVVEARACTNCVQYESVRPASPPRRSAACHSTVPTTEPVTSDPTCEERRLPTSKQCRAERGREAEKAERAATTQTERGVCWMARR